MLLSFLLVAALQAPAQDTSVANAIALLRSDVRANKAELIGRALALPDSQAQVFWPMYREYEAETAKLWDQRVQLIKDYIAAYDSLSDAKARKGSRLAAAFFAGKLLAFVLFGVEPDDASTFVATGAVLGATGFVACLVPAIRAVRVNPVEALRCE